MATLYDQAALILKGVDAVRDLNFPLENYCEDNYIITDTHPTAIVGEYARKIRDGEITHGVFGEFFFLYKLERSGYIQVAPDTCPVICIYLRDNVLV